MRRFVRLRAWLRGDLAQERLSRWEGGSEAYELVDVLPCGDARAAAWAAFALQTYGDKLVAADPDGYLPADTARFAAEAFRLAAKCVDAARDGPASVPRHLPRWHTSLRSQDQLAGMRDALEALRTYIAYEVRDRPDDPVVAQHLADIEGDLRQAERLWVGRDSPDIRAGLASALSRGLDRAYRLGLDVTASSAARGSRG